VTRYSRRLIPLLLLLLGVSGCITYAPQQDRPKSIDEILDDPQLLREQAKAALEDEEPERAFRYLSLIVLLHPDSPESKELYPDAATLYRRAYFRNRVGNSNSPWFNYEHALMYFWLSRFFESPDRFPQEQVDLLFLGMPHGFFQEFAAYAEARPRLFQRWGFQASFDDGKVESVTGERRFGT
jgi:hypothetical protein